MNGSPPTPVAAHSFHTAHSSCHYWGSIYLATSLLLLTSCTSSAVPHPSLVVVNAQGEHIDPFAEAGDRATVFLFVNTECPISNRYAPLVNKYYQKYSGRGVAFVLVYCDPKEAPDTIRQHIEDYAYMCDFVCDFQHDLVRLTRATVTPEVAIFHTEPQEPRLVYCGRIDNQYVDFGKRRPTASEHELQEVLDAILVDRYVPFFRRLAIGCPIPPND